MNIDLHIHTNASDGSLSPAEVVKEAVEAGLAVISIADHDTTSGVKEAIETQTGNDIIIIPGVEVSATDPRGDAHILGYWIDFAEGSPFQAFLQEPFSSRPSRIIEMCRKLTDLGLPVTPEEVTEEAGGKGSIGRPHLARVMLKKGYIEDMEEAFQRYLTRGKPAYVERFKNTAAETISRIHECGGISVIAHPGLIDDPQLVPALIEQGIMGLEAYCHEHDQDMVDKLLQLAEQHNLLVTGGSDYHGEMLDQTFKLGDLQVPYECYEELTKARG